MFNYNKINYLITELQSIKKSIRIEDIARESGVSKAMFDNIKTGKAKPTVEVMERIAIYFNKDMNFFFDTMVSIEIPKVEPVKIIEGSDYILKRFEELVAENALLRKKVEDFERSNDTSYTLQNVPVSTAAEPTAKLKKQK